MRVRQYSSLARWKLDRRGRKQVGQRDQPSPDPKPGDTVETDIRGIGALRIPFQSDDD